MKLIIIDTGPLLAFAKAKKLDVFQHIAKYLIVTEDVSKEIFTKKQAENNDIKRQIEVGLVKIRVIGKRCASPVKEAVQVLGDGEKSSILLALKHIKKKDNVLLVIDEKLGRKTAEGLGIQVIGSIGLLKYLEDKGCIRDAAAIAETMRENGYFFSDALIDYLKK